MGVNLLEALDRPEFAELRCELHPRTFARGSRVFEPHHHENLVFIVARGRARLALAYDEKEFTLSILVPGDIYSTHTRASVEAMDDLKLLVIPVERFADLLADHPALTRTMVHVLGDILRSSLGVIHSLVFKDIPRRVTELLLAAVREYGEPSGSGWRVRLDVTTQQMASIVGSTRQSVSEALSRLERDGLVVRESRGVYLIPDLHALQARAASQT
jgi:CRP-like cAMP-binding protein